MNNNYETSNRTQTNQSYNPEVQSKKEQKKMGTTNKHYVGILHHN